MKKILVFIVAITTVLIIAGCGQIQNAIDTQRSSASSLATLSYVSTSFLDTDAQEEPTASNLFRMNEETTTDLTEFESEIDEVNIYLDKFKVFIEQGTNTFGNVQIQESDHATYGNKMTFTINEDEYILYYDIDLTDGSIVGEFVIGDTVYDIEGYTNFDDIDEIDVDDEDEADLDDDDEADLDDDDENEADLDDEDEDDEADLDEDDDDEDEEKEEKMVLIARNGDDVIQITYKVETEDDEYEAKFELEQTINGEYKEISLKIEQEEDEFKIEIEDGENSYTIKRELEDDNEIEYKLEYEVNGVEGEVKVTERINEAGETIYTYEIEEEGIRVERETEDPDNDDDDDDDDDDENDEDNEDEDESSDSTEL